tara:strand:+ start:235 stop:435 length:201 start_codon:yes stop_codon:yes gene_type:complete
MKEKAIEIVKNLDMTINKLRKIENRVAQDDSGVFSNPCASVDKLESKKKQIIFKYKLKKEEYGVTN